MPSLHYLDTARLGQMSPAAKDAQLDFVRLTEEEPTSLYFEQFLRDGYSAWPSRYQEQFPGLVSWDGVAGLKQSLRFLAGAPNHWGVLLASRSLSLVKLAASCLFRVCRRVLTTDLSWPTYQDVVEQRAGRTGNAVSTVAVRDGILDRGWSTHEVAECLAGAFVQEKCDGLFLPAVDHFGIRLPLREIVQRIEREREIRFCVIDAAQAFCHVPIAETLACADFVVTGSHKWMRAYLPTGIGLFGQRRSDEVIRGRLQLLLQSVRLDDPLLQFTEQLETGQLDGYSETANLASLFGCAGAAKDAAEIAGLTKMQAFSPDIDELRRLIPPVRGEWEPLLPSQSMRSRIVLFESQDADMQRWPADALRRAWLGAGCIVSAYCGGRVRVSVPPQ